MGKVGDQVKLKQKSFTNGFSTETNYANDLLSKLDKLSKWPEKVKTMQNNWIGESTGLQFKFEITIAPDDD